jgi:hypothetical protein
MKLDIHGAFVVLVSHAVFLVASSAFAQSAEMTFALDRTSLTSVREYVAAEAVPRQLALPSNLIVSPHYRPLIEDMLRESPTFRRQCVRIAAEPRLTVELRIGLSPSRAAIRAQTEISRRPWGRIVAAIEIFRTNDNVELIGHEIEHVIEQLDEVDLEARAKLRDTGVHWLSSGSHVFETKRAVRVGLNVAGEIRESR